MYEELSDFTNRTALIRRFRRSLMVLSVSLVSVLVLLLKDSILYGKRLPGARFAAAVVISFALWCGAWSWFCDKWVAIADPRLGDWLPPLFVKFFYPWELVVAPFLNGAILYSAIFFYLKLLNFPEGYTESEVLEWRSALKTKFLRGLGIFLALYWCYLGVSR